MNFLFVPAYYQKREGVPITMIKCQHCGQSNAEQSNFCRFCGLKFTLLPPARQQQPRQQPSNPRPQPRPQPQQQPQSFEEKAPRPYSWKTDEYQVKERSPRDTRQIENMPSGLLNPENQLTQPLAHRGVLDLVGDYHCRRCNSNVQLHKTRKISTTGWVVFGVLLFTPLFLFCWIGLLLKEDVLVCPMCNFQAG